MTRIFGENAVEQNVALSPENSSTTPLTKQPTAGHFFCGTAVSTLGVAAVQVSLWATEDCDVWIDQTSSQKIITCTGTVTTNGTTTLTGSGTSFKTELHVGDTIIVSGETSRIVQHIYSDTSLISTVAFSTSVAGLTFQTYPWDVTDHFHYDHSLGGDSWTVQAVNSYARVRIMNMSTTTDTTLFRLQTVLCPVVEAVPRSLTEDGRSKVETHITDSYGNHAEISLHDELRVTDTVKLAGSIFVGTTVDPNFWVVTTSSGGTVTQESRTATTGGELLLQTSTTANGLAFVSSFRRGRYVTGHANSFRAVMQLPDTGLANNKRRWGLCDYTTAPTITDGIYFQLNGTTFSVATMRGGTETKVDSTSFNGVYGTHFAPDTDAHSYEIYYTSHYAIFSYDGQLLHTLEDSIVSWTNSLHLYAFLDDVNSGGLATNRALYSRSVGIHRFGPLLSSPKFSHIATATTTICKYGAGTLQSVVLNNPTNALITVFDGTTSTGATIAAILPQGAAPPVALPYGLDFSTGLTVVTAGTPDITVIYE